MLARLNARATGYSLEPPSAPNLFELARVGEVIDDIRGDIRDLDHLRAAMTSAAPEIVIHMAAQPLVRAAYADPVSTYATNVMGTVNVWKRPRDAQRSRVLIVTTDKCYENKDWVWATAKPTRWAGTTPIPQQGLRRARRWRLSRSYFSNATSAKIVSARAGNVIGGGDFAADRIFPTRSARLGRPGAAHPQPAPCGPGSMCWSR